MSLVRRHPLISFFMLAYALSWWPSILSGADSMRQSWLLAALWCAVAIVVVIVAGPAHLLRKHSKQVEEAAESGVDTLVHDQATSCGMDRCS